MRTRSSIQFRRDGSVLMVTLITALVIGIVLASYLALVHFQNATVMRSQGWNAALAAAEAGVEEALAQLNPGTVNQTIDRGANGWTLQEFSYVAPSARSLANGSYEVRFTDTTNPVIYSSGYITLPALKATLQRTVEVGTTPAPLFSVALAAIYDIDMGGNAIRTDSYNSTKGAYSIATARANGDVASINGLVNVRDAQIRGDLLTGPAGESSVSTLGGSGLVGDLNWAGPGIQTNHYANDFNVDFPAAALPGYNDWLEPSEEQVEKDIQGVHYNYVFTGSQEHIKIIRPMHGWSIYVGANATVNLWIMANVNARQDTILIEDGGKLNIYMDGPDFDFGAGEIVNLSGNPLNFSYYGLPNNTQVELGGDGAFCGTIYVPDATLTLSGRGDFLGASVARSVNITGDYRFHYDEALSSLGPIRGYVATSWRER